MNFCLNVGPVSMSIIDSHDRCLVASWLRKDQPNLTSSHGSAKEPAARSHRDRARLNNSVSVVFIKRRSQHLHDRLAQFSSLNCTLFFLGGIDSVGNSGLA